ncbi:hypothetical protein B296_00010521 [Ensete ventricosum]|uniref:J domain-containing protein n=1 Tax=Ensete ventricosum TaxID=4639 RepID=A0A426Z9D1_ENSVE|nr:hypothetical protein B296_00010521 [Ensete ventricosum]
MASGRMGGPSAPPVRRDPYEVLCVSKESSDQEIKAAYRKLALNIDMTDVDLATTSSRLRTIGLPTRTPHRKDDGHGGEVRRAHGLELAVLAQQTRRRSTSTRQAPDFSLTFLALEGGPMSQERPFGNSDAEHHSNVTTSANRGSRRSSADPKSFLENDDRPRVSLTRVQPCAVRGHGRGFPRPH